MQAIEREFGPRPWAKALYEADIRRPQVDDPHRQETNRWLAEWLAANGEPLPDSDIERLRRAFAAPIDQGLTLLPGATPALRWCKEQGLTVVLLSNTLSTGDDELRRNWDRLGPPEVVDHVVSSYSTGWMKPHPAMFQRALALAGARTEEVFMVGDSYELDVIGAKQLGIRAVWKTQDVALPAGAQFVPDGLIGSLEELPRLVEPWLTTETR